MPKLQMGHDEFVIERDTIDVTSLHRPDPTWVYTDKAGHEHRWFVQKPTTPERAMLEYEPATSYSPMTKYETPTLEWVSDGIHYFYDGDEGHEIGHLECRHCREHVRPGYCADEHKVYIPGIAHCYINGESVSKEEFERRFEEAKKKHGQA